MPSFCLIGKRKFLFPLIFFNHLVSVPIGEGGNLSHLNPLVLSIFYFILSYFLLMVPYFEDSSCQKVCPRKLSECVSSSDETGEKKYLI
jgi:hypothetical protein